MSTDTRIVVLDDDPTGSQTVHGCLLLTRWDPATLRAALLDPSPIFFVLTNTRGLPAGRAAEITREVCRHLKQVLAALKQEGRALHAIFASRSDSTLRGHYPVETDVMNEELGPFDAHFLVPAFFEGGRVTRDSVHYLKVEEHNVPVHETEFARDSVFGYRHSYLPDYVEEKTRGRIRAAGVVRLTLNDIRAGVRERLLALTNNACVVVDAERQGDLDRFADDLRAATAQGKRYLLRCAASILTSLARVGPQPHPPERMHEYVRHGRAGAVMVGSHVPKTTRQLAALLKQPGVIPIEVDVNRLPQQHDSLLREVLAAAEAAHSAGKTPVVYTSRTERQFPDQDARLEFGGQVSGLLMDVVRGLPDTLGFLISKGGITSNDILSTGLRLRTARLLGQILPGVSVVRCPEDHPRFPLMPVVIFPGNVGDDNALAETFRRLAGH